MVLFWPCDAEHNLREKVFRRGFFNEQRGLILKSIFFFRIVSHECKISTLFMIRFICKNRNNLVKIESFEVIQNCGKLNRVLQT